MLSSEFLISNKDNIDEMAADLNSEDIKMLVSLLNEKEDQLRYTSFLTLQRRSRISREVYQYWEEFCSKLDSDNSYQRSLGIMLIAENIQWDSENKLEKIISKYLQHCEDEKFITCRQTIQSLKVWISHRPQYHTLVADRLIKINIDAFKETQRKLVLLDILYVLSDIQKITPLDKIMEYTYQALSGGYLDKKSKDSVKKIFEQ